MKMVSSNEHTVIGYSILDGQTICSFLSSPLYETADLFRGGFFQNGFII